MNHQEFIDTLVPLIRKYCIQYSYPFVSPILAQAILESNWGTSSKAKKGYNLFGLKYTTEKRTPSAVGFFYDGGSEQLSDGSYISLNPNTSKWCKFTSYDNGVHGYFEFLVNGYGRYNNLPFAITPLDYLMKLKAAGYATDLDYVKKLNNVIINNQLTQYDDIKKGVKQKMEGINIVQHTAVHNLTPAPGRKIEWIVLHYTAGVTSKAGAAKAVASWFMNPQCGASADFIVDDATIVQYNPAPQGYYSWAVGGKKYSTLSTSLGAKYYGIAKNSNTINIEICSNKKNTASMQATDTDWYFTDAALNQALKLVQHLMLTYHIDIDHVITHHMVTGKICPNPWTVNEAALAKWNNFKEKIKMSKNSETVPFKIKTLQNNVNIRTSPDGPKTMLYTGKGTFTIVEEQYGWGLLKSYEAKRNGWIYLDNPGYIERI